jgi:hypothetical protein
VILTWLHAKHHSTNFKGYCNEANNRLQYCLLWLILLLRHYLKKTIKNSMKQHFFTNDKKVPLTIVLTWPKGTRLRPLKNSSNLSFITIKPVLRVPFRFSLQHLLVIIRSIIYKKIDPIRQHITSEIRIIYDRAIN